MDTLRAMKLLKLLLLTLTAVMIATLVACAGQRGTLAPATTPTTPILNTQTPLPETSSTSTLDTKLQATPTTTSTTKVPISTPILALTHTPTPVPPIPTPAPTLTPVPPSASFSVDVESGSVPLIVDFKNTSQGPTTSLEWDFGDGTISTDPFPSHRYTVAATYNVKLTVSGPGGTDTSTMPGLITVNPGLPAGLEISPASATLPVQEVAQFTAIALDKFGNAVPSTVTWSIVGEGGSIADDGRFTADTVADTFTDTITASIQTDTGELVGTASVTVEPGPVARVVVEPAEILLGIGAPSPSPSWFSTSLETRCPISQVHGAYHPS